MALDYRTVHKHRQGFEESIGDIWRFYNDLELALIHSPDNPNARAIVFRMMASMITFAHQLTVLEKDMEDVLYDQKDDKVQAEAPQE